MIEIMIVGSYGITNSIDKLIKLIEENPKEFIKIARIKDKRRHYSFIALFNDKCTIGKYSACLQEWGTNEYSGVGGSGLRQMNRYLEENNIPTHDMELSNLDDTKVGYQLKNTLDDRKERNAVWSKYAHMMI